MIISYSLHLERKITLPSTSTIRWKTTTGNPHRRSNLLELQRVARPSKLVSNLPTPLSNRRKSYLYRFPTSTSTIIYIDSSPDPDIFCNLTFTANQVTSSYGTYTTASPADKTTSAIIEGQDRQESSISSQSVEHCPSYENHNVTLKIHLKILNF